MKRQGNEGAYTFRPEWEGPNNTHYHYPYSQLDTDVLYQQGANLDQYTLIFNNQSTQEQAVIRVRFSPKFFEEMIEFEVEMNSIPFGPDGRGKDVTVNWKFFDGFDPKGKFWTD